MLKKLAIALPVLVCLLLFAGVLLTQAAEKAAATKTYQVTGPVVAVTDTLITVQKGNEKWELARDTDTKVTGTLAVGAKVTVMYRMVATSVEVKPETKPAPKTKSKP